MERAFVKLLEDKPYEKAFLFDKAGKKFRQVLWGDWLTVAEPSDLEAGMVNSAQWLWVRWAWSDPDQSKRKLLKVQRRFVAPTRPLEMVFVDVGIGDGAVLISPERGIDGADPTGKEAVIVIDAGKTEHMRKFIDERFKAYRDGFDFHAALISHPDKDHYYGFGKILSTAKITFEKVYHNGLVELNGAQDLSKLGELEEVGQVNYVKTVVADDAGMRALFDPAQGKTNEYAKVIGKGIENANVGEFRMLGVNIGDKELGRHWMPGFAPSDGHPYTIEVLGPWVEYPFGPGKPALRVFDESLAVTKNGHSVLLRLQFGNFSVLFGGDLNTESEKFLLQCYAGISGWPSDKPGRDAMVAEAAKRLSSDVMKSCHHGASDVTDEFLQAVNPAAFVISSGDEDANYVHPRPDLLGRLGKYGRGDAPVLLSTELQRSTRDIDNRELVRKLSKEITDLADCDAAAHAAPGFEAARDETLKGLLEKFAELALPSVAVDGAIYIKTDGETLIAAFKKETQSANDKWFYYVYRLTGQGTLELIPRPEH